MNKYLSVLLFFLFPVFMSAQSAMKWVPVMPDAGANEGMSVRALAETNQQVPMDIKLGGFLSGEEKVKNDLYKRIVITGAGFTTEIGKPELPVIRRFVQIRLDSKPEIRGLTSTSVILKDYTVYPVQPPEADFYGAKKPEFMRDDKAYKISEFYPKEIVSLGKPFVLRGVQVVPVEIYPIQYNPVTKEVKVHYNIKFSVNYSGGASEIEILNSDAAYTEQYAPLLQRMIINYQPPTLETIRKLSNIIWPFKHVDYLIITPDKLSNTIKPLADAKTAKGLFVKVTKLSQIAASPTAQQIADYIKKVYKGSFPRLSYVLLVGDVNLIPTFYGHANPFWDTNNATDLFYGTFSTNDYFSSVAVGRLPGKNSADIKTMVDKILYRESQYKNALQLIKDKKWVFFKKTMFNKTLHCSYDSYITVTEKIRQFLIGKGYDCAYVYESASPVPSLPTNIILTGTTSNIINEINKGVFLVYHRDHGDSRNGLLGTLDGWYAPPFTNANVEFLSNKNKYPVFLSINCRTGWFDAATVLSNSVDCLGEVLMKKYNAGAAGFIGATRLSPTTHNHTLMEGFTDALWTDYNTNYSEPGVNQIGLVLDYGKMYMANYHGMPGVSNVYSLAEFEMYNLLGDPEMAVKGVRYYIPIKFPQVLRYKIKPYISTNLIREIE